MYQFFSFLSVKHCESQQIDLDYSILTNPHFHKFFEFVVEKSIQLKSLRIVPGLFKPTPSRQSNNSDILRLLKLHCQNVSCVDWFEKTVVSPNIHEEHLHYMKFVNCLDWNHSAFNALYRSDSLRQIHLLTKLVIHLKYQGHIRMVDDIVKASWFRRSTKLVLKFWARESAGAADSLIQLNKLIQTQKKLDISLHISLDCALTSLIVAELAKTSSETTSIRDMAIESTELDGMAPTLELFNRMPDLKTLNLSVDGPEIVVKINPVVFSNLSISTATLAK
ncbi:unnamed protein product [Ambrosiozyma monospora]|uniref:Unnamed protein product n=1 Tax=Ambrosiozyma monospora TaxID=43982 RepID=A0ACB5T7A3_AMBMO|nr:unnamed protein product [Ambrosiozyma monospora]